MSYHSDSLGFLDIASSGARKVFLLFVFRRFYTVFLGHGCATAATAIHHFAPEFRVQMRRGLSHSIIPVVLTCNFESFILILLILIEIRVTLRVDDRFLAELKHLQLKIGIKWGKFIDFLMNSCVLLEAEFFRPLWLWCYVFDLLRGMIAERLASEVKLIPIIRIVTKHVRLGYHLVHLLVVALLTHHDATNVPMTLVAFLVNHTEGRLVVGIS